MSNFILNRREFITWLAASGAAIGLADRAGAKAMSNKSVHDRFAPFAVEGARLTDACMQRFWDGKANMFRAPVLSSETVSSDALHDRGYTLWPSLITLHCLIEGEKQNPGVYTKQIATVYDGLQQYYNPGIHAYTAWLNFPGNLDAYYDDNSWVVIIFVEAYLACRENDPENSVRYLQSAKDTMANYIVKGYDASSHPGGMPWGSDPAKPNTSDRGTSSTAGSALAAMMLARAGVERDFYTQWGHGVLNWLTSNLMDTDGLIMDALEGSSWKVRRIKYTYNTGVPMRAYIEHYRLTGSRESLGMAEKMAKGALDVNGQLFDQTVHDPAKRAYWDQNYFVHYLADGLLQVAQTSRNKSLAAAASDTVYRNANYAHSYLFDPSDGFYWRNWRLYAISDVELDVWQKWTGQQTNSEYDASERSQEAAYQSLSVKDRPLVKTMLANAGAARLFWLASRLPNSA